MKNKLTTILLITLLPLLSLSQENKFTTSGKTPIFVELVSHTKGTILIRVDNNATLNPIEGNPYLTEEFMMGQIYLANGKETSILALRYNIVNNQIEVKQDEEIFGINNSRKIDHFSINEIRYEYINNNEGDHSIYQVLANGACKLLRKYNCTLNPVNYNITLDSGHKTPYYTKSDNLYIQLLDNTPKKIKQHKHSILKE
ncbi:MAG: hypothetical protein U9R32_08205, partial [Bacteroidota bacterium]|nr:hypothetical protein [Bacteroidota bacterium]